ncbi:MAG: hypothetical protein ACOC44_20365 [Promethearchaeia archaeon]
MNEEFERTAYNQENVVKIRDSYKLKGYQGKCRGYQGKCRRIVREWIVREWIRRDMDLKFLDGL